MLGMIGTMKTFISSPFIYFKNHYGKGQHIFSPAFHSQRRIYSVHPFFCGLYNAGTFALPKKNISILGLGENKIISLDFQTNNLVTFVHCLVKKLCCASNFDEKSIFQGLHFFCEPCYSGTYLLNFFLCICLKKTI
jgi:hypothetical protein